MVEREVQSLFEKNLMQAIELLSVRLENIIHKIKNIVKKYTIGIDGSSDRQYNKDIDRLLNTMKERHIFYEGI